MRTPADRVEDDAPVPASSVLSRFKCILVPTDFSPAADAAWSVASALASSAVGAMLVLNVDMPFLDVAYANIPAAVAEQTQENECKLTRLAVAHGLPRAQVQVRSGDPATTISEVAREFEADLVVIGAHEHHGLGHLFFSRHVVQHVVRTAPCDVLVVKPPRLA